MHRVELQEHGSEGEINSGPGAEVGGTAWAAPRCRGKGGAAPSRLGLSEGAAVAAETAPTLTPCTPPQEYRAAEQEMQRQTSLGEVCYPTPLSFEPVKSFFQGFVDAMQSLLQTPLDTRLKESKLLSDQPCVLSSPATL